MKKNLLGSLMLLFSVVALIGCDKPDPAPAPDPKPGTTYDYTVNATYGIGEYVYNSLNEGLANYYLVLSEMEVSEDFKVFSNPGLFLAVDLYAVSSESMLPPVGTYSFKDDMTEFSMSTYTNLVTINSALAIDEANLFEFADATLEVAKEGDIYTLTFIGETLDGAKSVSCVYKGKLAMHVPEQNIEDVFPPLVADIATTFVDHRASYYGKNEAGVGRFVINLFDYMYDGYSNPGAALTLELYSNIVNDEVLPVAGRYTVAASVASLPAAVAGTLNPGYIAIDKMQNLGTTCSFTTINGEDLKITYGIVSAGSVDVVVSDGKFTVTADLATVAGKTIKGKYEGVLNVKDRSYYSTITEDKEVILGDMPCEVEYYGQSLKDNGIDGDNWMIYITSGEVGSDGLQLNLVTPAGKLSDGLPLGEYEVRKQYDTGDYICLPGEYDLAEGGLYCSWYVGDLKAGGIASQIAPFREGIIYVDKTEGLYSIMGEAYDDFPKTPNALFIVWEGSIDKYIDKSQGQANVATPYLFKTNVKPKVQVFHNEFVPAAQIKGQSYTNTLLRRTLLAR